MPEYIDKTQLLQIESLLKTEIIENNKVALWLYEQMTHDIEAQPVADVAPVVHGKWIFKERHRGGFRVMTGTDEFGNKHTVKVDCISVVKDPYCSVCGKLNEAVFLNYCPNCGAKMDLEE